MTLELAEDRIPPDVAPGSIIADRYRVESTLGHGGMGIVLAARHMTLGQRVAIKLMLPAALADAGALDRFMREAWASSRINSEYVTRVFDMGELPSGAPYIVMEFLEGEDLAARLKRAGRLPILEAASFALQVCEALAEAHAIGIVHRDLKPSNVFCVRRSDGLVSIKVLDFGISKLIVEDPARADQSLTSTRSIIGSPFYMSPEQMRAPKTVDARSDVWSLGVMLYETLSGSLPFQAETLPDLAVVMATEEPAPLAGLRPELPASLIAVVERCLQKQRDRRYADVGQLAQALVPFAPPSARSHAERAVRVLRHASTPAQQEAEADTEAPAPPAKTSAVWLIALLLSLLAAGGAWSLYRVKPAQPEPHIVRPRPPSAAAPAADEFRIPPSPPPAAAAPETPHSPEPAAAAAAPRPASAQAPSAAPPDRSATTKAFAPARTRAAAAPSQEPARRSPPAAAQDKPASDGMDELGGRL